MSPTAPIPAATAVEPFVLKDIDLVIDADNFAAHVSSAAFVPSASQQTWKGLKPSSTFSDVGSATYVCNLEYAQDWSDPASLSSYLMDHEGEQVDAILVPRSGAGLPAFTATLTITPGQIGGAVDAFATASVSLGSSKPVRTTTPSA